MRIAQINEVDFGSTGTIMRSLALQGMVHGDEVYTFSARVNITTAKPVPGHMHIGTFEEHRRHVRLARWTGLEGCFSIWATLQMIREIEAKKIELVHLHSLYNHSMNLPILFRFLRKSGIPVVWTMHDCWAFTGHCPYFDLSGCNRWRTGCHHCPVYREYPASNFDNSFLWKWKKKWFTGLEHMVLVSPSVWLKNLLSESFLGGYPIHVIPNGINRYQYSPRESDFRQEYHCEDKVILLGVTFWPGRRKGLDVFIELSKRLDPRYQIVLVGTNDEIDALLPPSIISVHRTKDPNRLAQIYSAADIFINPTREDNFPTVNLEALACGTPIIAFRAGGATEAFDESCGRAVACDDVDGLIREIEIQTQTHAMTREACLKRAEQYALECMYAQYHELYRALVPDAAEQ